jgi:hypothetical protein
VKTPTISASLSREFANYFGHRPKRGDARKNRVVSYTAAASAFAALLPGADAAPVVVVPGSPPTAQLGVNGTDKVDFDLDGGGVDDFRLYLKRSFGSVLISYFHRATARIQGLGAGNGVTTIGDRFAGQKTAKTSFNVNGQLDFQSSALLRKKSVRTTQNGPFSTAFGAWTGGTNFGDTNGFLGIKFQIAGQEHFGWIHLSVRTDGIDFPNGIRALDWAYESEPGVPLHIGDGVPEVPASAVGLGALALGAAGIQRLRKTRQTVAAKV